MIIAEGTIDFENKIKRLSNDLSLGGHEAEVTFQMILEMSGLNDARVDYLLAIAYLNGYGTEQNCAKSAYYYRKAISEGSKASYMELFDTLWRINTPESLKEMVDLALPLAESGNRDMCGRMGRAYRDGRGVPKNLGIAADWMRKAADQNLGWAKNELFDILWRMGTPESYKEMISVATAFAEAGDSGAMGRVGRMYRDGKGVGKDLNKAAEWMRKAADKNVGWAKNELFDILWKIDTPEALEEMLSVATEFAEKGDGAAMGRLGRAYRHGKGVPQDLNIAAEWMRKAADKNVGWAKNELFDLMCRRYDYPKGKDSCEYYVLFDVSHYSLLSVSILLRIVRHNNNKSILLITKKSDKKEMLRHIQENGLFDIVIEYDPYIFKGECHRELLKNKIVDYFDAIFEESDIKVDDLAFIYTGGDLIQSFGMYLYIKSLNPILIEADINQLNSNSRVKSASNLGMVSKEFGMLQEESGIIDGTGDNIMHIIFNNKSRYDNFLKLSCTFEKIDLVTGLKNLSIEDKELIKKSFNFGKLLSNSILLLNSRGNAMHMSKLDVVELPVLYRALADFYGHIDDRYIIKKHPEDTLDVRHYIKNSEITGEYPVELLCVENTIRLEKGFSIDTSAGRRLADVGILKSNVIAGREFYTLYPKMHIINFVLSLSEFIEATSIYQNLTSDVYMQKYISVKFPDLYGRYKSNNHERVISFCSHAEKFRGEVLVKIGELTSKEFENFKHLDVEINVYCLKKNIIDADGSFGKYKDEIVTICSKNSNISSKIKGFDFELSLDNLGISYELILLSK